LKAVVVDPDSPARLKLADGVEEPAPAPSEAVVEVRAISLNRGEVRRAEAAERGHRPGWDLAGVVHRAAEDGIGPPEGARVVGLLPAGAWAERVAVPTDAMAELAQGVSFEAAATLPVAGLTALYALEEGGNLLGRTVLVTGASGGAGDFGIRLARLAGARVVGLVRREEHVELVRGTGAHEVVVSASGADVGAHGPYHVILDSVGGEVLGNVLPALEPRGTCVTFGVSVGVEATIDVRSFYLTGGARLYGFFLFYEVGARPAADGLARLAGLVAEGRLKPRIEVEASWEEVGEIAERLTERGFTGKAVLRVEG
jgi:NADPH:quinone reductase-like Zn-dependent oxidoreductase